MLTRAQIKENAKAGFKAAYWPSVGVIALMFLINLAINRLIESPAAALALEIGLAPLNVGMCGFFLCIYRRDGDTRVVRMFNIAFSQNYGRKLGGMAWMMLWIFLWILPIFGFFFCVGIFVSMVSGAELASIAAGGSAYNILLIIGAIGCLAMAYVKYLSYCMTPFYSRGLPGGFGDKRADALKAYDARK